MNIRGQRAKLRLEQALLVAQAILDRAPDRCAQLGALPGYYYGEDCDFEEFFHPEESLQQHFGDPDWGLLDEPVDRPSQTLEAIAATVAELQRAFDHGRPLSARLRMRILNACRVELAHLVREYHGGAA